MKTKSKLLASVLCLLLAVSCVVGLTACGGDGTCYHQWGKWTETTVATCTETGIRERVCLKCGFTKTATIDALGHYWIEATCSAPKTCKNCLATEGTALAHSYNVEAVKDEALKSAASCTSAAVYYKSCSCGAISTDDADTFTSDASLQHKDENLDHVCDNNCGESDLGNHADENKDHICDYGCADKIGICTDDDFDHDCDYGCDRFFGICEDTNKDHECDHGCEQTFGEHSDSATDGDHICDYGCGAVIESCSDAENDGNHSCDICGNIDASTCIYKDATCGAPATCFECGATTGSTLEHIDANRDHVCDNNCGKNDIGDHSDSAIDNDHLCDYGCTAILESCFDAETDNNHDCDVCGKENVSSHAHVENTALATKATCLVAATKTFECSCGDTYTENDGDALGHDTTDAVAEERHVGGCEYVLVYRCQRSDCGQSVLGETVYHHNYIAGITTAATCTTPGEKTFECSACGDRSKEAESIPADATGHKWTTGNVVDGIRTDVCSVCSETKTVTVYTGNTTDEVNAGDLADKEIELNDANISLDSGVIDAIGNQNITVSADKLEGDDRADLGLSKNQLAQVGNNPIYNFTINNGTENISNFGEENYVTITLPYVLAEGEDVDSIAVWFINDNGELESIPATYNNGYVTFKTNHFSYYTVTKLTPAERCALYGHGYAEQVVEGSCTKDGYVLLVCVRCHNKQIKEGTLVAADGHDYTATTQAATCTTQGYISYACNDCNYSYKTKINASGHSWSKIDSGNVSCNTDGFVKYGCEKCDEEYTVSYAKTGHIYTETVVPATCASDGYTIYDCDNCDYSYTDAFVKALGHNYEVGEWTWEANGNKATLSLICEHDSTHTTSLHVISTMEKEVEKGTCSNYVIRTHTASVEYNGVIYTDVMIIRQGNPTHAFSSDWTTSADEHWRECICGEKTDVSSHTFESATVTKDPTCTEAGESTSYCTVCGKTEVSLIPPTAEHIYVDGFCSTCGKSETTCDHTELNAGFIDIGAIGGCDGVLSYYSCSCGEVKVLGSDAKLSCTLDNISQDGPYTDENGNGTMTIHGACHCGLEALVYVVVTTDGCTQINSFKYVLSFNGEPVIEMTSVQSNTLHSDIESASIDLSEYGVCGGYLLVYRCQSCGVITDVCDISDLKCNIDLTNEPKPEEKIDENGNIHYIQQVECPDCGLVLVIDNWSESVSVCETKTNKKFSVYRGETKIAEIQQSTDNVNHVYEYKYEVLGSNCNDGVKVNVICSICGYNYYYETIGHIDIEEHTTYLEKHYTCGGWINASCCKICGDAVELHNAHIMCKFGDPIEEAICGTNGEIVGYKLTYTCPDCGLIFIEQQNKEYPSICECIEYEKSYIYVGEECILRYEKSQTSTNHQYEIEYVPNDGGCDNGYLVIRYCIYCGDRYEYSGHGHKTQYRTIYLSELGLCDTQILERYCEICGKIYYYDIYDACRWDVSEKDADGYTVATCLFCGVTKMSRSTDIIQEGSCTIQNIEHVIYMIDGQTIYSGENQYEYETHELKYEYFLNGTSCSDGYTVICTCANCDLRTEETSNSHNMYVIYESANDRKHADICEDHHINILSCPCGQEFHSNFSLREYDENLDLYVCENCSVAVKYNETSEEDGCSLLATTQMVVYYNGEELCNHVRKTFCSNHNFTDVKASESNGMISISASCNNCDATTKTEFYSVELELHDGEYYFDFTFVPDESASYIITGLMDSDTYVTLYTLVDGQLVDLAYNDDGASHSYNQFLLQYDLTAGATYVYRIRFLNSSIGGSIDFSLKQNNMLNACMHDDYSTFYCLLPGSKTCEDGVLTGIIYDACGCVYDTSTIYTHKTFAQERIELADFGACNGTYTYSGCACGQSGRANVKVACSATSTNNQYYDEEGRLIQVNVRTCSKCGLRYTTSDYTERDSESCSLITYYTVVLNIGDTLIAETNYTTTKEDHNYEITGTLVNGAGSSCVDGVIITQKCKDCGYETSSTSNTHKTYEKEIIDLSAYGSVCGGYAILTGCACGDRNSLSISNSLCDLDDRRCDLWIENAITGGQYQINGSYSFPYTATLYTCAVTDPADAACAYKIRYARYWVKDANSCIAYRYETWQFGYNEQTDTCQYSLTFKYSSSSQTYHNYIDSSTDNHMKYDCPDCGSYYYENQYYDNNHNLTKYERFVSNTVNDRYPKYSERIEEYVSDASGGYYTARIYEKEISYDGDEYWFEEIRSEEDYTASFGDSGLRVITAHTDSNGLHYTEETAYVQYKGYKYTIYTSITEDDYWYRYDYTYSFDNGCVQTSVYTDSNGETEESTSNICKMREYVTIQYATCTQDGKEYTKCVVCDKANEVYTVNPTDHEWVRITDTWYYCFACGLENANGASGDIVMEDLTGSYGNGEYYVVGYYSRSNVQFSQYVSLVLTDGTMIDILSGIDFITIDGIRAYAFSKSAVEAWATERGYTNYAVRLSFVPVGSDGSFDYGITFTPPAVAPDVIVDSISFVDYIDSKETKSYIITPTEDSVWTFTSQSSNATIAYLYDADGNRLTYDNGTTYESFNITYELKAGETYTLKVKWRSTSIAGDIVLFFASTPIAV